MKIMENESNTKETWYRNEAGDEIHRFTRNHETAVWDLVGLWDDRTNKKEENITLIAASPDMLEALEKIRSRDFEQPSTATTTITAEDRSLVMAAIAKATLTTTTTNTNKGTKQ